MSASFPIRLPAPRTRRFVAAGVGAALLLLRLGAQAEAPSNRDAFVYRVLELTNAERARAGLAPAGDVAAGWMPPGVLRRNILNGAFKEIGIGVATGNGGFGTYWTQDF